MTDNSDKS